MIDPTLMGLNLSLSPTPSLSSHGWPHCVPTRVYIQAVALTPFTRKSSFSHCALHLLPVCSRTKDLSPEQLPMNTFCRTGTRILLLCFFVISHHPNSNHMTKHVYVLKTYFFKLTINCVFCEDKLRVLLNSLAVRWRLYLQERSLCCFLLREATLTSRL